MIQEEVELALRYASEWPPHNNTNPLRQLISRSTYRTYIGERTIDHFVNLFKTLVSDEGGVFAEKNIDMRLYFINSLKTQDINLECMEEAKLENEVGKIANRKANLIAMIKGAIDAAILSDTECKIHFSSQLLENVKVIPSKLMFDRRLIRLNTAMLYKQNKFNLLREDMVGYSALINDIVIGTIDLERDEYGRLPPTPMDRIPRFLDIISSHIGNFHLDPNRVLDILLDFFIKEVMLNYAFWIELFKQSVWIRQLNLTPDDLNNLSSPTLKYNTVMAHLLGFKFENYHLVEISAAPVELYYSCALLIKSGLIRFCDLLPYLAPNQEQMDKIKSDYLENMNKEIKNNSGGLLAQYGALGEEGATKKAAKSTKDLDDGQDQAAPTRTYDANDVVELTKALLSIGDITHSEEILSKYNKLCDMFPVLAHYIYRLCSFILEPAYQLYVPEDIKARSVYFLECAQQSELKSILSPGKGDIPKLPNLKTYFVLDFLKDGTRDLKAKRIHRFFYTQWSDQLETSTTYDELLTRFMPIMRLAGYRAYLAPNLIQKLVQILLALFERNEAAPESPQRQVCITLLREFLLPAISFSGCNTGLMANVWEILELLSFQERCCLYGEWGNDFYKKSIETKLLKARVERNVKSVMRRVSKNDVRPCSRDLGKLTHSNPTIVFSVMLDQIQSFDNLAPYMADACRYMNNFCYDILGYFMAEKWTGSQGAGRMKKVKEKEDGATSIWLRALSVFSGMLYKKQGIDPTPLIRYLVFRLRHDDSVADLILFNEFITKLCGIEIIGSTLTDDQITSAGCSDALKSEAFQPISTDNRRATKRVLSRLKDTLKKDDAALELLVLLYRLHESCSSQQDISTRERVIRLNLVHQTILQFSDLLTTVFDEAEYCALIPSAEVLSKDFGLPYTAVMQILRPKTRYLLRNSKESDSKEDDIPAPLQPLILACPSMMQNGGIFDIISAEFFVIFWQLSLYDIHCPVKHYEAAMKRYSDIITQCRDPRSSLNQTNRQSAVSKMERQARASLDALQADLPKHQQDVEDTMKMLKASHSRWFGGNVDHANIVRCILQFCFYPRSVISEVDAVYCYKFAMVMHSLNVNHLSSLAFFHGIISDSLPASLITFTDYETTVHARFLFKTFSKMAQWHKDEKLYCDEAHGPGLIGFQRSWPVNPSTEAVAKEDLLSHSDFVVVMGNWHQAMNELFKQALQSGDSHQIRNTFLILRQFIPNFPTIREDGESLVETIKALAATEKRDDLKVLARSYLGLIEKNKARWVSRNSFINLPEPESLTTPTAQPPSKPLSPRPHHNDDSRQSSKASAHSSSSTTKSAPNPNTSSNDSSSPSTHDRKRYIQDNHTPSFSSRTSSSIGTKRLRSDDMEPATPRRDTPSETRNSRHHRSEQPSSTRHSSSSRGTDMAPPQTTTPGIRIRDQAREAVREAARDTSRSLPPPNSSPSHSSNITTGKDVESRESRRSTKTNNSRHHWDTDDLADRRSSNDHNRLVEPAPPSSTTSPTSSSSTSSSSSSSRRKRSLSALEDDGKDNQSRSDKRYRSDRSSKDHKSKKRSDRHSHEKRRSRHSKR
ncbi:transcription factor/nuclear export subunit protein 2-domain-containing protein [Chlamydoabsidia padenii]|nr:transcription factor/nuclear export subunit protein 2-domain-containing protein [Chlamydoabsidia padenii]